MPSYCIMLGRPGGVSPEIPDLAALGYPPRQDERGQMTVGGWRVGVGRGCQRSMWLAHVVDATPRRGWGGGMLTFHVTCSRCWCYATQGLGWGGDVNIPCDLLTLLMLRHAGVGVRGDVNIPCDLLTLLMLRHAGVGVGGDVNIPCDLLTLLMLRHAGVGVGWGGC